MTEIKLKSYILNFLTVIVSVFLCLLIANIIFISVSTQKFFPRALANSLSNILLTFYPDTYNKDDLKDYVAILGDSYSLGVGDAYLNGKHDYSLAHHLYKNDIKNYLNFGRAGYGSISAVSNLIMINKLTNLPNLIEDLEKPKSIIFVFYEGNDLDDLNNEITSKYLMQYLLNDEFTQNLKNKQNFIDKALLPFYKMRKAVIFFYFKEQDLNFQKASVFIYPQKTQSHGNPSSLNVRDKGQLG